MYVIISCIKQIIWFLKVQYLCPVIAMKDKYSVLSSSHVKFAFIVAACLGILSFFFFFLFVYILVFSTIFYCVFRHYAIIIAGYFCSSSNAVNEEQVKPRSLRFTWSMKTTSSRDPNEIMTEIRKVCIANLGFLISLQSRKWQITFTFQYLTKTKSHGFINWFV